MDEVLYRFLIKLKNNLLYDSFPCILIHAVSKFIKEVLNSKNGASTNLVILRVEADVSKAAEKMQP